MSTDIKQNIANAIAGFAKGNLTANALNLFNTLGYNTERQAPLHKPTFTEFKDNYIGDKKFDETKALCSEWKQVDLLFQLSTEEMLKQESLFKATVERNDPASYLFFTIELTSAEYSRNQLAQIAREMNKPFPMHVFVLFKYGNLLSFSLIDRRQNKKVMEKDVMEKVTHIYNINIEKPHAAHIQILSTFSFDAVTAEAPKRRITNFADLQNGWRRVISTDILNKEFYLDYQKLSVKLINAIYPAQVKNKLVAHQGVLNLLNRIMFIYFVQKKKWIMKDDNFILHFWTAYQNSGSKNIFHDDWLNSIFFAAFNGLAYKTPKALKALPEPYKSEIVSFPYLNGGLFAKNADYDNFILPDNLFYDGSKTAKRDDGIFNFFESYIFTISEDTPYDVNLEINPSLLGKMYEGMINATDLDDVDAENGIIYTEPPEINFMVRRSFVEVLDKKMNGSLSREFLYHFIFDTGEQKKEILKRYKVNTKALREAIAAVTSCDPACGSGSMLLGVIQLQMELLRAIDEYDGNTHSPKDDFTIKKQLISECIYGVDIKEWAVRIAELRLWLYMIAEAEFTKEELTKEPLLPNLDFKLRCGNSLLQKFGNLDFTITDLLKGRDRRTDVIKPLNDFIKKKKAFILNQAESKATYKDLEEQGRAVFIDFIQKFIIEKEQQLHKRKVSQGSMFEAAKQNSLFEEESNRLQAEMEQLKKLRAFIIKQKRLPFSYDIDFMEIFVAKEQDPGFDLMIGNPPYVRQEQILPPEDGEYLEYLLLPQNKDEKARVSKEYKEELNAKVYKTYPFLATTIKTQVDGKNKTIPVYGSKVPGRSDLYCYFQLLCPAYLNSTGTFCFIISNSWLDVDFGSYVQQFLLKHTKLHAIYDCNVRSFDAKVNTIIYLHTALKNNTESRDSFYKTLKPDDSTVQFVMNKIDYANASYAPLLLEQEHSRKNTFKDLYRIITLTQNELYTAGCDDELVQYAGDKWGGKHLRAPEIYYTVLQKGKDKLVRLGDIADIRFGIKTGANEFFVLDDEQIMQRKIEQKYISPFFTSPKDCNSIFVEEASLRFSLFNCSDSVEKLKGSNALKYIKWGEVSVIENGKELRAFHKRSSVNSRINWYSIGKRTKPNFNCNYMVDSMMRFYHGYVHAINNFHEVHYEGKFENELSICLNSSLTQFFVNVLGRSNLGDGLLKIEGFEVADLMVVKPISINVSTKIQEKFEKRVLKDLFTELGFNRNEPIREQQPNPLPDRKELDDIIFDELGLTQEERNEVYWSVGELVKQRLDKAASR